MSRVKNGLWLSGDRRVWRRRTKVFAAVFCLLLCLCCPGMTVFANEQKVVDKAGLLTEAEASKLQAQFEDIAEEYGCDVVLLTLNSCSTRDYQEYNKAYYQENGYGCGSDNTGIMLMVTMAERQFWLTTIGEAQWIFTNYGLQVIDDEITGYLSDGDYYKAFRKYGTLAEEFVREAQKGQAYDSNHTYSAPMALWLRLVISLAAGLIVAAAVLLGLRGQLKSVGIQRRAQEYVRQGSFRITRSSDIFLYRTIQRHKIEKAQNHGGGGGGGSGPSSGGHGGSF